MYIVFWYFIRLRGFNSNKRMAIQDNVEVGRKSLESILNVEAGATKEYRNEQISWNASTFYFDDNEVTQKKFEWMEERLKKYDRLLYIRADSSDVIGRGTNQLVVDVGNGLVAKMCYEIYRDSNIIEVGRYTCLFMEETRKTLVEIGMEVPEICFYRVHWDGDQIVVSSDVKHRSWAEEERISPFVAIEDFPKPGSPEEEKLPNAYITADLREGGRFSVIDYEDGQARKLPNGPLLISAFESSVLKLLELYQNLVNDEKMESGKPFLSFSRHKEHTPEEAVRRMFFLQVPVNPEDEGKLVIGDIDHVNVCK